MMKKSADKNQILGHVSVGPPFQFDAKQLAGRARDVESTCFKRWPDPIGMTARFFVGTRTSTGRTIQAGPGIGECSSTVETLHLKQSPFEPDTLGANQCRCIRNREVAGLRYDLCGDKQYGVISCKIFLQAESEWRTAPTAAIIGTGTAIFPDAFGIAEAGDIVVGRQCRRKILSGISEHCIHMTMIILTFRFRRSRLQIISQREALFQNKPLSLP